MKALAELLTDRNWNVTGSDLQKPSAALRAMRKRGLHVHFGHQDHFLPGDCDVLIYSPAVGLENPERRQAEQLKIPQLSYTELLGQLMQGRQGLAITGTHGKSTTTAMTSVILRDAGLEPSAVIGAELIDAEYRGSSGWAGSGELFVVEGCEYQRNFLQLKPQHAAILGIEPDHFDYFTDTTDLQSAFAEFAQQMPTHGTLLVRGDCPTSAECAVASPAETETFSLQSGSDWWATDIKVYSEGVRFRVFYRGNYFSEITLRLYGEHNVLNALAAIAMCHRQGVASSVIRESLENFLGVRRRFEHKGTWRGVSLMDDFAHHPSAVKYALRTARQLFGKRRILCAFQPHQISRTEALLEDFAASFGDADAIMLAPIFAAREQNLETQQVDVTQRLADRLDVFQRKSVARNAVSAKQPVQTFASLDQLISTLEDEVQPGDVLITMGAGDIDRVHHELTRGIQRHHS